MTSLERPWLDRPGPAAELERIAGRHARRDAILGAAAFAMAAVFGADLLALLVPGIGEPSEGFAWLSVLSVGLLLVVLCTPIVGFVAIGRGLRSKGPIRTSRIRHGAKVLIAAYALFFLQSVYSAFLVYNKSHLSAGFASTVISGALWIPAFVLISKAFTPRLSAGTLAAAVRRNNLLGWAGVSVVVGYGIGVLPEYGDTTHLISQALQVVAAAAAAMAFLRFAHEMRTSGAATLPGFVRRDAFLSIGAVSFLVSGLLFAHSRISAILAWSASGWSRATAGLFSVTWLAQILAALLALIAFAVSWRAASSEWSRSDEERVAATQVAVGDEVS